MQNPKDNIYAYAGINLPIPGVQINKTGYMLAERVKLSGNTAIAIISTANANLDGTGTTVSLITGADNGTIVKRITVKAQGTTTQGVVRIFYLISSTYYLIREIEIPAMTQDSKHQTFIAEIAEPIYLSSGDSLKASTEKGETFILTAEGVNMTWPD